MIRRRAENNYKLKNQKAQPVYLSVKYQQVYITVDIYIRYHTRDSKAKSTEMAIRLIIYLNMKFYIDWKHF